MDKQRPILAVVAVALVTALSACSSSTVQIVTSDSPKPSPLQVLLRGTLEADENGCVRAKTSGDRVTLVWPQGYTVKGDRKSFEVLDASKNVVLRSGSSLSMGGGLTDKASDSWGGHDCVKDAKLWMVGDVGGGS